MKCRICNNELGNTAFELKEMMYGLKERFDYFQCGSCDCIQIKDPPGDMNKYYPGGYYAYKTDAAWKRFNLFKIAQSRAIIGTDRSWLGKLISWKYKPPAYYLLLKELGSPSLSASILDIGSGTGELLGNFYQVGYKDLTGIDPFIEKDIVYNTHFRIEKKTVFDLKRSYDVIMLHHSLEHMDRQHEVMSKIYQRLNPKGKLLVRIPVVSKPLMAKYGEHVVSLDPPRHFYIHSATSFSLLANKAGFKITRTVYDAHEFSFWGSEQYIRGISLHNDPRSFLVKKTFSDEQMLKWKEEITTLNERCESDNAAFYLEKI